MELIEQLYFRAVTPSDFRNMYELAVPDTGHGQTYIEAAGISDDSLRSFLCYAEENESGTAAEPRPTYFFNCHVLGDPQQQAFMEFAPRRGRNYRISRQTTSNRHPAWRPSNRFPEPHRNSTGAYIDSSDFAGIIDNLIVVVIRSSHRKYYAWFCNEPSMPDSWPKNIGLESLFIDKRRGILSFDKCQVQLIQDQANPFHFISGNAATLSFCQDEQYPYQRIFYGAPGTGKSYQTNEIVAAFSDTVRTTFHPDSDYASFVGCYKPSMKKRPRTTFLVSGTGFKVEKGPADPAEEDFIAYEFVPQAYTNAYVRAWEKLVTTPADGKPDAQFLVIEEINRGNCAQVFGDLFQLLDRHDNGFSQYPINADADLGAHLEKELSSVTADPATVARIDAMLAEAKTKATWADVVAGRKLVLPPNLYIWATMNTSDQSLFPMDSAFKRRWDWKYVPIRMPGKKEDGSPWEDWTIRIPASADGSKPAAEYAWWNFLRAINGKIGELTSSEDKKLGYFFVKGDSSGAITLDAFVNKVVFYLWNDAFRAVGTEELGFEVEKEVPKSDGTTERKKQTAQFEDFFGPDGTPDSERIRDFLTALHIQPKKADAAAPAAATPSPGAAPAGAATPPPPTGTNGTP